MKTKRFGSASWLRCALLGVSASLALGLLTRQSGAQITLIDFENIPPTYTPVDSFGPLLPGVTLISSNQWIADEVCNSCFENVYGRAITAFPDSSASLSIIFDALVKDVTLDLGSSTKGSTLTVGVTGYRDNHVVFSDSFVTHPVAGGADEVRAHTFGIVDRLVVGLTAGGANPILDNLSFITVPERDSDGDGVPDSRDLCPGSPVADADGCSIDQLVPCAGPRSGGTWRNHGHYVSEMAKAAAAFVAAGLLTEEHASGVVNVAARSSCGKK
jgi:hypothetical protein